MGFLGVYTAVYTYTPQSDQELAINEGDLLYIIEKSTEDDWWKAKKRAEADGDEEPVGLIPSNYIEEVSLCPAFLTLDGRRTMPQEYVCRYETNSSITSYYFLSITDHPYLRQNPCTMLKPYMTTRDKQMKRFHSPKVQISVSTIRLILTGRSLV
jgi:hypothetical protein